MRGGRMTLGHAEGLADSAGRAGCCLSSVLLAGVAADDWRRSFHRMQRFEWTDELSVGIPRLDAEHRQILQLLRDLRACAYGEDTAKLLPRVADELTRYAEGHLRREELLLGLWKYPRFEEHRAEHDHYRARVETLLNQLARRDIGVRVTNFLCAWWREHILTSDQAYARHFRLLK